MATGTTANAVMGRNRIVELAIRACRGVKPGQAVDNNMMRDGISMLNEILREEDNDQTGELKSLWAMAENYIFLAAGRTIYAASQGLASDIHDIESVCYRDTNGDDSPLKVLEARAAYDALASKNETGDPEVILFVRNQLLASQSIQPWPIQTNLGTTSVVEGSDALQYSCILGHTSSTETKPITGASYRMFWKQTGSGGSAWADATAYTNGALIKISYKRPLYDFDLADNDPDLPFGWGNYLKWRLALEMAPHFKISLEERGWFAQQMKIAHSKLFPHTRNKSSDYHNKATYF